MVALSTINDPVDITHRAGDTLTVKITAPATVVDGLQWDGQVRSTKESPVVDATFAITPPSVQDGPAYAVLTGAITAGLVNTAGVLVEEPIGGLNVGTRTLLRYTGVYDVQVSDAGSDPVTTLVHGTLTIELDVTRLP